MVAESTRYTPGSVHIALGQQHAGSGVPEEPEGAPDPRTRLLCLSQPRGGSSTGLRTVLNASSIGGIVMANNHLSRADSGREVQMQVGESLDLRLDENPTTGFQWQVVSGDKSVAEVTGDSFQTPGTDAAGAGGTHTFTITAHSAGRTTLRSVLARSWERDNPEDEFELTLHVSR